MYWNVIPSPITYYLPVTLQPILVSFFINPSHLQRKHCTPSNQVQKPRLKFKVELSGEVARVGILRAFNSLVLRNYFTDFIFFCFFLWIRYFFICFLENQKCFSRSKWNRSFPLVILRVITCTFLTNTTWNVTNLLFDCVHKVFTCNIYLNSTT